MICFLKVQLKRRQFSEIGPGKWKAFLNCEEQQVLFKASFQTGPLNAFKVTLFKGRNPQSGT